MTTTLCQECENQWSSRVITAVVKMQGDSGELVRMVVCTNCLADIYEADRLVLEGLVTLTGASVLDVTAEAKTEDVELSQDVMFHEEKCPSCGKSHGAHWKGRPCPDLEAKP